MKPTTLSSVALAFLWTLTTKMRVLKDGIKEMKEGGRIRKGERKTIKMMIRKLKLYSWYQNRNSIAKKKKKSNMIGVTYSIKLTT